MSASWWRLCGRFKAIVMWLITRGSRRRLSAFWIWRPCLTSSVGLRIRRLRLVWTGCRSGMTVQSQLLTMCQGNRSSQRPAERVPNRSPAALTLCGRFRSVKDCSRSGGETLLMIWSVLAQDSGWRVCERRALSRWRTTALFRVREGVGLIVDGIATKA